MKKIYVIIALVLLFSVPGFARDRMEKLVLAGPKSSVTHPMAYMIEAELLKDVAKKVELVIWDNPDQLRSLVVGGQAHFSAMPSYVAANFYNKGVPVRLLNISAWGILWIVSSDPKIHALSDLKGEELSLTYRGDMPDLVLNNLALKQDLKPGKDFKLNYLPSYSAVVQEVLSGRGRHGLLSEPLVSVALMKSAKMKGKTPRLYRSINIQEEWGKVYNRDPQIPQAGICAMPAITKNPKVVKAFQKAYSDAIDWCNKNPEEAGRIVVKYISGLKAKPVATALKNSGLKFVSARDAKPELEHFYNVLKSLNPAKIGGKLPGDDYYWGEQ